MGGATLYLQLHSAIYSLRHWKANEWYLDGILTMKNDLFPVL